METSKIETSQIIFFGCWNNPFNESYGDDDNICVSKMINSLYSYILHS
jgi:hypothetical protein